MMVFQALLAQTESVPYALSWGEHIAVAGTSRKVQFYSPQGESQAEPRYLC